ncbi:MAG: ATPase, T2SS/T4P/T4SS family [Planctomycetota bacterium]|nr:ATPase, T2SS/T4P/T4SS family [Planctomycetota bacterium]
MTTTESTTTENAQDQRRDESRPAQEELTRLLLDAVSTESEATAEAAPDEQPALAEALLRDSMRELASDIHVDPQPTGFRIRLRIDGVVHDGALLAPAEGARLVNQIKAMASIDPVTMFMPAEARIRREIDDRRLDLRVTLAPCLDGPKFAIRVLERQRVEQRMDELGLSERDYQRIRDWLGMLTGMFVVAGPTGVGKTTTLYALLHEMKLLERCIITLEDPVEYSIEGVNQIQIDEEQALDFPTGIKAALHLDPDYLLVGEMRDAPSARAAMDAATAGRTLLTTVHSKDAVGAITAMRNLGLADHEIAASTSIVVAQRLVRRLCPQCRREAEPTEQDRRWLEALGAGTPEKVWEPVGCDACNQLGFRGRIGVFEVWVLDDDDRKRLTDHADSLTLRDHLVGRDHHFLLDDALAKAEAGITSLSELRMPGNAAIPARHVH